MTFLVYRSSYAMNTDDDNKVVLYSVQRLFNFLFDACPDIFYLHFITFRTFYNDCHTFYSCVKLNA